MNKQTLLFVAALFVPPTVIAEELPPVKAEVYFSKNDPRWKNTEAAIDAVTKEFKRVQIDKISIDDDKGYAQLTDAEKSHQIQETGDITLIFGPFYLTNKGDRRNIDLYFESMVRRILQPEKAKGRIKSDPSAYADEVFGKGARLEAIPMNENPDSPMKDEWHRVFVGEKHVGWIADVFWPIACPICNDSQFLVAISISDQKILNVRPVRELERLGRPLDAKESVAFTAQFKNLTPQNDIPKIDAISGATKTTNSYQSAVGKILEVLKRREVK